MNPKLKPNEVKLVGSFICVDGEIVADEANIRIQMLIKDMLDNVGSSKDGWDTLYRDPLDDRFWELTYKDTDMHGGGVPILENVSERYAGKKYKI